ncbi:glycosyltransferase [Phytoactinopolyspora endophytica]|uniref:glycosyltransferase n=1 Tax=Phytoactinopolyspora endophytica TaxID=1642495 RepID=UPI00101BF360
MKVLLLSQGTRGDIQPYANLARALRTRGHEPILGAPRRWVHLAEPYGVRVALLYDAVDELLDDPIVRDAFETNYRGLRGKAMAVKVMQKFRPMETRIIEDMARAAELDVDIVVFQPFLPGHAIGEWLGVPAVPAGLQPIWVPTRSFPNPMVPFRVPRLLNRSSYLWTRLWYRGFMGSIAKWRTQTLGLERRRGQQNSLRLPNGDHATVIHAFSRHLLPLRLDYPDWVHTVGYWFPPSQHDWTPPKELLDFLEAGDPPVCVGFGSMVGKDPRRTGAIVADAVRRANVRAVIVTGSGGIDIDGALEDNVLVLREASFDWLFPRMSAIVHHGGSGTSAAALASGRPQVVCPFMTDQPFHARRMHAIGVAPPPLPQVRLTADNLSESISRAVTDRGLVECAETLGERVKSEDGLTATATILESMVPR